MDLQSKGVPRLFRGSDRWVANLCKMFVHGGQNDMGCFVFGCFVLHSSVNGPGMPLEVSTCKVSNGFYEVIQLVKPIFH